MRLLKEFFDVGVAKYLLARRIWLPEPIFIQFPKIGFHETSNTSAFFAKFSSQFFTQFLQNILKKIAQKKFFYHQGTTHSYEYMTSLDS